MTIHSPEISASKIPPWAAFRDPALCYALLQRLKDTLQDTRMRFMEVCGTHTVAIFHSGLRALLPPNVIHISGPGCPVCVTHDAEIATFLTLTQDKRIILATFGDLLRVPGPKGYSLKHAQAEGAHLEIVYSPLDALELARKNPQHLIVFLGIGFETTAPAVAATMLMARNQGIDNFTVLSFHKLVPPALQLLLAENNAHHTTRIEAFLLPGHVSTVLGLEPYRFLEALGTPGIVAGFDPVDILLALCLMAEQHMAGTARIINAYARAVDNTGNPRAQAIMNQVFIPADALWRGIGSIPLSGLAIRPAFASMDAMQRLGLTLPDVPPLPGCRCGEILKGRMAPPECPLFDKTCTPATPVGPCMVSTEGSCAAYHKYALESTCLQPSS